MNNRQEELDKMAQREWEEARHFFKALFWAGLVSILGFGAIFGVTCPECKGKDSSQPARMASIVSLAANSTYSADKDNLRAVSRSPAQVALRHVLTYHYPQEYL